ncbi:nucleoside diphosphate-linked moiety X motif 8 isoform X2 [Triplophysa rosa]|uniref:nucleoside diphosphate-linked moiety X motif 8 isoform X2 n=1 Tax=Triplophysa rosa TaxID=992332 RepID=UPI002545EA03|nr:nucleoside diphosphate-linked moiety X motif 8 isoform X2 [Triplophysa rosa]
MFRAFQMKNSVNLLRIHRLLLLTLRDSAHERTVTSLQLYDIRRDTCFKTSPTSIQNISTLSRRLSAVTHTFKVVHPSKTILIRVPTHFLLGDIIFTSLSRANKAKTFLLLCTSLLAPLSVLDWSKCTLTLSVVTKHKKQSKGGVLSVSNTDAVLSVGHFEREARSATAVESRGLHTDAHRWNASDMCLSAGNEAQCKRSLQPNAALYERGDKSWAAVLVCLCVVSGQPALLFTLRSAKLKGRHKGDVSFAGGKKDSLDRTVVDTALREAREELGIHITEDQVWGVLKPLRDTVEEIFTLTLEDLCQPQNRGYTHFRTGDRYGYTLPVFHSPKYRVWGLTAVAVDHTLKLIVPPRQELDHSVVR